MIARALPQDLEEQYHADGYVVVRGWVPLRTIRTLERWVVEISTMEPRGGLYRYYERDGRQLQQIENACAVHEGLHAFAEAGEMLSAVSRLFGEPARLFKDKINFKLPGGAGYAAHRDGRFWWTDSAGVRQQGWDVYASDFISVLVGVDANTIANGCLEIAPARHRDSGESYGPLTEAEAGTMTFVPCPTEPGDVVFFNALAPHRSGPNLTSVPRRVLYLTYHPARHGDQRARYFADKARSLALGAPNR